MNMKQLMSATALAGILAGYPAVAAAQTTTTPAQDTTTEDAKPAKDDAIVVTGSRIARPTLESPVPVTTVSAADLLGNGQINIGDALNDLPALRSTFSQANSTRFIGTSGLNVLDLRGIGTSRTLVLVNGRRHITASPGDYLVDTNTIPDDLLERVDIVTGGNSAVYGSDAVAGVVNFILKRNFEGIKIAGQGGVSQYGDRGSYFGSVTVGKNFADGRGNIALSVEYSRNNALYFVDRPDQTGAFDGRSQFNLSQNTAGESRLGDGIPDSQFYNGVRNGTIADGGIINAVCGDADLTNLARCRASTAAASGTNVANRYTASRGQRYAFDRNGNLVLSNPAIDFRDITNGGSTNTVGGLGSTLRNTGQLAPLLERYSANLLAHFDISDAFKPFVEAKYVRIYANQEGQPSFFSNATGTLGLPDLSCSNGFLTAQNLAVLQSIGRCLTPTQLLSSTAGGNLNTGAFSRFNVDFGGRGELHKRETYRVVAGIEGNFNDDWHYEIAANYGQLNTHLTSLNNLKLADINGNLDGFSLAYNAVLAPATFTGNNFVLNRTGQKVICAVNSVTNARPDCIPINLFGDGAPSAAALAFVNTTATRVEKATEFDATVNISGDLSQLFELPGGPVQFNIGGEYRQETARSNFDALTASGGTFLNAIQPFTPPKLTVKEGFAEIVIPVLKDMPFFEELTLGAAGRISDYNTNAGTTYTYNGNIVWAPIHDIKFRASYGRSVRVPTQSDLYSPNSQNFAFVGDPCDVLNITTTNQPANRAANCAAAGVPVGFINSAARAATLGYLSGGNAALTAEKSQSYTIGAIIEPSFIPGLSFTIDWYDIVLKDRISTVPLQTILNQCYDAPSLNNGFCNSLNPRDPVTHFFAPVVGVAGGVNFAATTTSGVDFDLQYNHTFSGGNKFSLRTLISYVIDKTNFIDPTNPRFPDRQLSEIGDPQIEGNITASYTTASGFTARYNFQYIGRQVNNQLAYETLNYYYGLQPTNADAVANPYYPEITYHNIRFSQSIDKKFEFYVGVDNIFNRLPPNGLIGNEAGGAIFDNTGRFFYSGFRITL